MLKDIINQYQLTYSIIESTPNPKTQLFAITGFFKFCNEKKHTQHYFKFLKDFIPYLINIFKNSNVDFIDPENLLISKYLLRKAKETEEYSILRNEINSVLELLNLHLLVLYYHLGEIDNGIIVLNDLLNSDTVANSGVSIDSYKGLKTTSVSKNNSLVDPALFKINKAFDLLRRINYELNRLNSFSDETVNILLVEAENSKFGISNFGIVQDLTCTIYKNTGYDNKNPLLENITDSQDEGIERIRNPLISSVNLILEKYRSKLNTLKYQIRLRFADLRGIYKGTSFGTGAAILISSAYLNNVHSRVRFLISGAAAFTGSIDDKGNVLKLPEESIKTKTEAAFYSWIKFMIVPRENLEHVNEILDKLSKKYPKKKLEVIGINNVSEIFDKSEIIKFEKDTTKEYLKKSINRHKSTAYTIFSIILVLTTALAVYKLIPRKYKPLPQTVRAMNMIYTPDRDTVWKFINGDGAGGDTLNFGEIGIGDALLYKLDLWNNDDVKTPLRYEVQGTDADEFEVLWGADKAHYEAPEYINPDIRQRVLVKYVPYKSEGYKNAVLVFYNADKPEVRKTVYLKGRAGTYKTGYSLKFKDDDYGIINPERGNVLGNEFTISFWFKSTANNKTLLIDDNSQWTLSKFQLEISDTLLELSIIQPKVSGNANDLRLHSKSNVIFNEWNYAAIVHKNNETSLILNDDVSEVLTKEEHFNQIEDYFILGGDSHPLLLKETNAKYKEGDWNLSIAEFKIYSSALTDSELEKSRFDNRDYMDKKLLAYIDFEEGLGHFVFDKTKNDFNLELFGHPQRTLDRPPLRINSRGKTESSHDQYIKVYNKGIAILNKNVFKNRSSFTIQFEAKAGNQNSEVHRNYCRIETMENSYNWRYKDDEKIIVGYTNVLQGNKTFAIVEHKFDFEWHKYVFDYSVENNTGRLFIDNQLIAEVEFGNLLYDISQQSYCIFFGNSKVYDNPRYISESAALDNIAIFNKTLSETELILTDPADIKNINGIISLWTFSKVDGHVCNDEINNLPMFIWDEFEVMEK